MSGIYFLFWIIGKNVPCANYFGVLCVFTAQVDKICVVAGVVALRLSCGL
jgi:hypothetical protein